MLFFCFMPIQRSVRRTKGSTGFDFPVELRNDLHLGDGRDCIHSGETGRMTVESEGSPQIDRCDNDSLLDPPLPAV